MVQTAASWLSKSSACPSIWVQDHGHWPVCFEAATSHLSGLTRGAGVVQTYLFNTAAGVRYPVSVAAAKTGAPFGQEILRGIFCNWMVCLGIWQVRNTGDTN